MHLKEQCLLLIFTVLLWTDPFVVAQRLRPLGVVNHHKQLICLLISVQKLDEILFVVIMLVRINFIVIYEITLFQNIFLIQ